MVEYLPLFKPIKIQSPSSRSLYTHLASYNIFISGNEFRNKYSECSDRASYRNISVRSIYYLIIRNLRLWTLME